MELFIGGGDDWIPPPDRPKRRRDDTASSDHSDSDDDEGVPADARVEVDGAYSPSSPQPASASPSESSLPAGGDFSADVVLAVRRFERAARGEFRALLQQGLSVQNAVDRLLGKLSTGVRNKPPAEEVDALAQQTGLDPEVASWALMLHEELSRLRRCGTPPPDSVDVLTSRLQNSNLDVEPPPPPAATAAAPPAAASPVVQVPAAAEAPRKRGPEVAISSVEEETQKRRREEKNRMGAVLDAVAAAVRANNAPPPPSPPKQLISALLRRSSQSELEDDDEASRKRRGVLTASEEARLQKKTRPTPSSTGTVPKEG